ncbi:uncharacterized protein Z518_10981 [Rhinocladiella mackenziei CBS 650.93]|uniref:Nephrocystin 3-like N-terminal domain-containing protein n=1 Tax=Rhinocladiella mackenziei CBS 650.93 TaxID=1442369 RepID=A0A0D2I2U0_9EURO|nr:uncharacterized protein Z518_10981 [Rhinocladiella mackenziei CBS 650.93]KIX00054.1 hypothetical protein Z518_10981 [Rhinocladiella mackenziei CBS 650.93]
MAELIGVASGIAGLVNLTLTVSQVSYEYMQKVRNAPRSTSRYLQEVLALSAALLRVQETLSLPGVESTFSSDKDLLPKSLIAECRKELETTNFTSKVHAFAWPFEEKETKEIVEKLARWSNIFNSIVTTCSLRISNATLTAAQADRDESRRTIVLDWIYSNPSAINNNDVFRNYCEDTCSWILDDRKFRRWHDEGGKSLFCTGGPGVGKTTLASFLVNHLTSTMSATARVLYHYFDFRAEHQYHTGVAVVRNLLRQLLENDDHLPEQVLCLYEKAGQTKTEPTDKVWIDTLCKLIPSSPQVYVMIDGFDECPDHLGLSRFFRHLKQTAAKTYVAGRAPIDLPVDSTGHRWVEIIAPKSDLATFIKSCLEEDEELESLLTESLRDEVVETLIDYADGVKVFLLVKMALDNFTGFTTVRQIRKALLNVPKNLRSAHQATLDRILSGPAAKRDLALKTLAWVLRTKRPLTLTELLHALALEPDDVEVDPENLTTPKTVIGACLGYIEHRESNDLVQFTHATVEEYLDYYRTDIFQRYDLEIARSCVNYLAQPAFAREPCRTLDAMVTLLTDYPLLGYAASHWGAHAAKYQKDLTVEISKLLQSQNSVSNVAQVFHYLRRTKGQLVKAAFAELPQAFGKMHLLALWGLKDITALESPSDNEITAPDSLGRTPLHWAAARGHHAMLDFLVSRGAHIESRDLRRWTPLFWAIFWSPLDALRYLVDQGANIQAKDMDGNTPLHIAVSRANPEICDVLLRRNADWSVKSFRGSSPFDLALRSQVPEIASMFLDLMKPHPMSVMAGHTFEETVLERAVAWFPAAPNSVFRATLEGETTAAERSDWPRPLLPRLTHYKEELQQKDPSRLTSIGLEISHSWFAEDLINQNDYVAGVLAYAILTEHTEMVKALIDTGVDLNKPWPRTYARIQDQQFPVLLASYTGNVELINMLRGKISHAFGLAKLIRAHQSRHWHSADQTTGSTTEVKTSLDLAESLVQNGGDVNLPDRLGNTPLHDSVQTGQVEAVRKLIQLGADVSIRANKESHYGGERFSDGDGTEPKLHFDGHTPFTLACMNHELDIASALRDAGAVLPEGMDLRQPLKRAIADGDRTALRVLFSFGSASLVAGSDADEIPLLIVAVRSLQWVVDGRGQVESDFRRPFIKSHEHVDPLEAPEKYRFVIELLLSVGQDPNATDDNGRTALLESLEYDFNKDTVNILLNHGANVHASDNRGMNALHVAAAAGFIPFVKLMLSHTSNDDNTPLSLAAANGHEDVVRLLLEQDSLDSGTKNRHDWLRLSQCYNAIKSRDVERFRDLSCQILPPAFVDRAGQTLLHLAADTGIEEMVSILISLGADVNAQNIRGDTSLHIAAASETPNPAVIRLLVNSGADMEARNYPGNSYGIYRIPHDASALHLAAYTSNLEIVEALLDCFVPRFGKEKALGREKGVQGSPQPMRAGSEPVSSLSSPATSRSPSRERYRHWEPPYIDLTSDRCGRTALMCAVEAGDVATVKYLLEMGANVNASGGRGSWGFNALDLALSAQKNSDLDGTGQTANATKSEMVELLESHGAEVFDW